MRKIKCSNNMIEKITIEADYRQCYADVTSDGCAEYGFDTVYAIYVYINIQHPNLRIEIASDTSYKNALFILCDKISQWARIPYEKILVEGFSEEFYDLYIKYKNKDFSMMTEDFAKILDFNLKNPSIPVEHIYKDFIPDVVDMLGVEKVNVLFKEYIKTKILDINKELDNLGMEHNLNIVYEESIDIT